MKHEIASAFNCVKYGFYLIRQPHIILVAKKNHIARGVPEGVFKVSDNAFSFAFDIDDPAVSKRHDLVTGFARGVVIGNDYLIFGGKLAEHGAQLLGYIFLTVAGGESNRNFHISPGSSSWGKEEHL